VGGGGGGGQLQLIAGFRDNLGRGFRDQIINPLIFHVNMSRGFLLVDPCRF